MLSMKQLPVVVVALLAAALALFYYTQPSQPPVSAVQGKPDEAKPTARDETDIPPQKPSGRPLQPLPAEAQAAALAQADFIDSLYEAGADGAPSKMETVYAALSHTDPEIREAAGEVLLQYGGREAIPRLAAALSTAPSAAEKLRLEEIIEFLKLPSPSDPPDSPGNR